MIHALRTSRNFYILLTLLLPILIYVIIYQKGCNSSGGYDPLFGGRCVNMFHVEQDTTKPKPINHKYSLTGSDTLFNLLWTQITSPDDVTPRNTSVLKQWLQTSIKQDTTNAKQ